MKYYQITKKRRLAILVCLGLLVVILGGYRFFTQRNNTVKETDMAGFDLDAVLREHPNWERYQELQQELDMIRGNWDRGESPSNLSLWPSSGSASQYKLAPVDRQMIELQNNYRLEENLKWGQLQKALQDYHKRKMQDLDERFKIKFETLKKVLNDELEAKQKEQQGELNLYRKKIEEEQHPTLANLQLRLVTLGVSRSNTDDEERVRIQKEINLIKDGIEDKIEVQAAQYEKEFGAYQKQRTLQLNAQLKEFEVKANIELRAEIKRYQDKLAAEFQSWRTRRQQELNKSLEKRRQEQAQQQLLLSQQIQVYDGMMRDIRKVIKEYAQRNKIGCVIAGQPSSGRPDLTRQLAEMLK